MAWRGESWLAQEIEGLIDLFFPPVCPVCRTTLHGPTTSSFCASCSAKIVLLPAGRCSCCALPFTARDNSGHLCADCTRQHPPFAAVYAAGLYEGALKQALQRFKYSAAIELDRTLASLLLPQLPPLSGVEIFVPVPLHPRRMRQRGYNQALLLARALVRNLQNTVEQAMLERTVDSHSQQGLDAHQRALNLNGAFRCQNRLDGKTLVLVDDVMTTGATVGACSRALLDAGAKRVIIAVIARAPRH